MNTRQIPLLSLVVLFSFSCKKEEEKIMMVRNDNVTEITSTTAKATATIIDIGQGITQHGHCWSTEANPTVLANENMTNNGQANNIGSYTSILTDLTPDTKYFVRAYVKNGETVVYGEDISPFSTLPINVPVVSIGTVSTITTSSAIISGYINNLGAGASSVIQHGHCWSDETTTPVIEDNVNKTSLGSEDTTGDFESHLVGLDRNTLYYVRAYAVNDAGTSYSDTISFKTNAELPVISTSAITSITDTTALSGGNITNDGGATVTARGVCWSTSENPSLSGSHTNDGSGTGSYISNITGLSSATKYYVRAYATNIAGSAYGNQISFTTGQEITSPILTTEAITSITMTSAQSGGNITSGGGAEITARGVCWSTNNNPTLSDDYTTDGIGPGSFVSNIEGLSPGNTYYVRAYATNNTGTAYGNELSFTTEIISWVKSFGGSNADRAYDIKQTSDKGYIIAGRSNSNDGDVSGNHGDYDCWVVKLNSEGTIQWQKSYGGSSYDRAYCIQQTYEGGYIISGRTDSEDGDIVMNKGGFDCLIIKTDAAGGIDWHVTYGGSSDDYAYYIEETGDGGYIYAGHSNSNGGDVTGNHGDYDYWIVKLGSMGEIEWEKSLGGSGSDGAACVRETTDDGYIVAGNSDSNDGNVTGNKGLLDYWIVKLNFGGDIVWQKSLGGSENDYAYYVQQTTDGGYIVAGYTESNDGDITNNNGNSDCWIVKLTSAGIIEWQKSLGGSADDIAHSIQQTSDGGYIIAGATVSNDGDVTENKGVDDFWIVKLNSSGEPEWQKSVGGSSNDSAWSVYQTNDGGYIIAGDSKSDDGDVSGNHGDYDFCIVKINTE